MRTFLDVDPRTLRLPTSRLDGADPAKLQRQIARYGNSVRGMPPLFVSMSTTRSELLDVLAELSDACPEMRMGQLLANLATLARGAVVGAIWEAEDEELLDAARRQVEVFRTHHAHVA